MKQRTERVKFYDLLPGDCYINAGWYSTVADYSSISIMLSRNPAHDNGVFILTRRGSDNPRVITLFAGPDYVVNKLV